MTIDSTPVVALLRDSCRRIAEELDGDAKVALGRIALILQRIVAEREAILPREVALEECRDASDPSAIRRELNYFARFDALIQQGQAEAQAGGSSPQAEVGLDLDALCEFFRSIIPGESQRLSVQETRTASRGFSKRTVLARLADACVLPNEIALRIDQPFNHLGTRIVDEYPVVKVLWDNEVPVPQPWALESSGAVLGQPFLVSSKVEGATIGGNYVFPPRDRDIVRQVAEAMAKLHRTPVSAFREAVQVEDADVALDREIAKYRADWQALNTVSPVVEAAFKWIDEHRELGVGFAAPIHNDFNFNNILFANGTLTAVVDWEFARLGHPAADLGYFHYSAEAVAGFGDFLDDYVSAGGKLPAPEVLDFYILWGQLRLLVICFQVECNFNAGEFDDVRFGFAGTLHLGESVRRVANKLSEVTDQAWMAEVHQ